MEVVDPDRGVDQDHLESSRRRGAADAWLSEPPRAASRLALSTRIKVSSPSRKSADRSVTPVNSVARAKSSSSMVTVVLIGTSASRTASHDASNDAIALVTAERKSHVEAELHHVAVAHDVVLALDAGLAGGAGGGH